MIETKPNVLRFVRCTDPMLLTDEDLDTMFPRERRIAFLRETMRPFSIAFYQPHMSNEASAAKDTDNA